MEIEMMTQEDKELLLKDLCGRLPYDIVVKDEYGDYIEVNIHTANLEHLIDRVSEGIVKMVLRPMSSQTSEEREELNNILEYQYYSDDSCMCEATDWLNKNMFDFRGLIPKGHALSTEEYNPYKD